VPFDADTMRRKLYLKAIAVAEACYICVVGVVVLGSCYPQTRWNRLCDFGWPLFFAAVPLGYPLKLLGVRYPVDFLVGKPLGWVTLLLFYAVIFALLGVAVASLVSHRRAGH